MCGNRRNIILCYRTLIMLSSVYRSQVTRGQYILLIKRLAIVLVLYSFIRLYFFLSNYPYFSDASVTSLLKGFILGLRFDLIAVTAINLPFIFLSLLPIRKLSSGGYQRFLKGWFLLTNIPFIFLNLSDSEYFKFTGKRSTFDLLRMANDILNQALQLMINYWPVPLLTIAAAIVIHKCYPSLSSVRKDKRTAAYTPYIVFAFAIGLCILILRGTTDKRPITLKQAFTVTPVKLGHLVLNTPFSFLYTIQSRSIETKNYFPSDEECLLRIEQERSGPALSDSSSISADRRQDNIVIIILESFGREYIGYGNPFDGYTPFLDSLAGQGLFFTQCYANGRRSIEALPAILAGIPSLMDEPYVNSMYQNNDIAGLGSILKKQGYHTSFFHGGINGTMGFDAFSAQAGFDHYYGMNEYPEIKKDYDGKWGIYDEPFLQFYASKLNSTPQPFCSAVFTLSSHPPYSIPPKHVNRFPKGPLPIHETIGYTDHALRRFFEEARHMDWYSNTLFIITADHTQEHSEDSYKSEAGDYLIPLIFFKPQTTLQADTSRVVQQTDISPSITDYLGIKDEATTPFGYSVFAGHDKGFAINQTNGVYRLIRQQYVVQYSDNTLNSIQPNPFSATQDSELLPSQLHADTELLKSHIQYFNNGLINNRLLVKNRKLDF